MQQLLRHGMKEGALGLSTGLTYPPGSYAGTEELVELCKTVAECGGVYVTHVRYDLGDGAFEVPDSATVSFTPRILGHRR